MDIQRIQTTSTAAQNQARTEDSKEAREARNAASGRADGAAGSADALDLQSAVREAPELTAARAALRNIDTMDDARRAEIQAKIQSGYYNQPETIAKVSDAMADALQSGKKAD